MSSIESLFTGEELPSYKIPWQGDSTVKQVARQEQLLCIMQT